MGLAGAYAERSPRNGALALAGGLCVTAAWFLPWCTMHFGRASAGGSSSAPIAESPAELASQAVGWQSAWLLLLATLVLVGVGVYVFLAQRGDALALTLTVAALLAATYSVLGLMAVPQIIAGRAAPGVYLVPELGAAVMLAGVVLVVAACVRAWRRL